MINRSIIIIVFFTLSIRLFSQNSVDFKVMFYNLENLFDIYDDTTKWDEQFLPDGDKHWTANKYETKLKNIAKVITAVGGWQTPAIIGVCEVENLFVLEELTERSPIAKLNYQIIHKESPDNRGIDVALLYQSDDFTPLYYDFIPIHFPNSPQSKTRDILYAKGLMKNKDTLHVFVNHWPSRWGGQMKTENKRIYVAETLRKKVDSLYQTTQNPNIVIMGDFNDTPTDKSILEYLKGMPPEKPYSNSQLYNLMYPLSQTEEGTHPYQGHWAVLDQFIVSGGLINGVHQTEAKPENAYPFKADFLLEDDTKYGGKKTNRSYIGFKYNGGYSDHLPIVLDLDFR